MTKTAKERFQEESKTIDDYVNYIENNFYQRSCSVVKTQGYEELQILNEYVFFSESKEEKENNKVIIDQLEEIINNKIDSLQPILSQRNPMILPTVSEKIISNDLFDSLGGYIESTVYDCMDNSTDQPYYELIENITPFDLKKEIDSQDYEPSGEKNYDMLDEDDYKSILSYIKCKMYNDDIENMKQDLEEYCELKTLYNIFNDKNPINIYRQAFILLMTAFDAAVFDIFTSIFTQDFFGVAKYINYDKKYSIGDITKFEDFDAFALNTIETMISGKYVSDILEILHNYKNELFIIDGYDKFENIMEMIQRRNLHVHKNGIIDEKYFTKGNGSQLGVKLDDYAVIDNLYYYNSSEILVEFILNI